MSENKTKALRLDIVGLIKILIKWKKQLIIITIASAIAAFIITSPFFMEPEFKSNAILYPSNLVAYSEESNTEQMLQLLQSEDIRDRIIETFDLYEHYKIDTLAKFPKTEMYNKFKNNIIFSKTEYESISITVWDTDPMFAAAICDSLITYADDKIAAIQRKETKELLAIVEKQFKLKKIEMDSMENTLKDLRERYDILDYQEQTKSLSKVYYKALLEGKYHGTNRSVENILKNLKGRGGEFIALNEHLYRERGLYNDLKKQYEDALRDLNKELTYSNVVTRPVPAERKSYPIRSLIMLLVVISTFFLAVIVIINIENYRSVIKPQLDS
ncbi:MAG: hypothetical protein HKN22_05230 [Bacteroidia bacterium]|nr:hypothetical protein [Bacteroidia bacterium]